MSSVLKQRRLRWLGHVCGMVDGRISKDILYGELAPGKRPAGRPQLRYKDVCRRSMEALNINTESWEEMAADRSGWCKMLKKQLKLSEEKIQNLGEETRARRKACTCKNNLKTSHIRIQCDRDCHPGSGLTSHSRRCSTEVASLHHMPS